MVPALLVLFKNLDLNFHDSEFVLGFFSSSRQNWYKLSGVFEYFSFYSIKSYFGTTASRSFALSIYVLFTAGI